jgi:hypothetical protein
MTGLSKAPAGMRDPLFRDIKKRLTQIEDNHSSLRSDAFRHEFYGAPRASSDINPYSGKTWRDKLLYKLSPAL